METFVDTGEFSVTWITRLSLRGGESERERERERKFTEFPLFRLFGIIADCLLAVKY